MDPKKTSAIRSVMLNAPTFHEVSFDPTLVNFFFGRNGTGKSTIAKAIAERQGLDMDGDKVSIMAFDRDYIHSNVAQLSAMPGILMLGKQDIEAEARLTRLEEQRNTLDQQMLRLDQSMDKSESVWKEEHKKYQLHCWQTVKDLRERYSLALAGFKRSSAVLTEEMERRYLLHRAGEAPVYDGLNVEQLDRLYHAAFDEHAQMYEHWKEVRLGQLPECALLQRQILSSQSSAFGDFIQTLGAVNWVRDGHDRFHERARGKCPYCQQMLPESFEARLGECFDQRYERDLAELRTFRFDYRTAGLSVWNQLKENLRLPFPAENLERYQECISQLEICIRTNLGVIDRKLSAPEVPLALQDANAIIRRANDLIYDINEQIEEHNRRVASRKAARSECADRVFDQMISRLHLTIEENLRKDAAAQKKRQEMEAERNELGRQRMHLMQEMEMLRRQMGTSAEAAERINTLLAENGYEGFSLREKAGVPKRYEAVRPDGSPAEHLSEGETGFLAFLYFYQTVLGLPVDQSTPQERILVIDDPVSGMDNMACAAIGNLTYSLAAGCCGAEGISNTGHIGQMFVLTHNLSFYRRALGDLWRLYDKVSLYQVEKRDNCSALRIRVHREGNVWVNDDPAENSYLALWIRAINETDPMQKVQEMRQILDRYLIQMCGFTQFHLQRMLEQSRDMFCFIEPDGGMDMVEYYLALWMLGGELPGFDLKQYARPDVLQSVFRKIFACMHQDQHYSRMLRQAGK